MDPYAFPPASNDLQSLCRSLCKSPEPPCTLRPIFPLLCAPTRDSMPTLSRLPWEGCALMLKVWRMSHYLRCYVSESPTVHGMPMSSLLCDPGQLYNDT